MRPVEYRRMRFKCNDRNFAAESWAENKIGVWYGAWGASEFKRLCEVFSGQELCDELTAVNKANGLDWAVTPGMLKTVWKFWDMRPDLDWVFTQFEGKLHIAQLADDDIQDDTRFEWRNEIYKARSIKNAKSFQLSRLPDCFRLLAAAGRSNCHEVYATRRLISLLSSRQDEADLLDTWKSMSLAEQVDLLGDRSWESIALAYLILERSFVPVGLGVGGTLPVFDHVGRSQADGSHIFAQCKGDRTPVTIGAEFLDQVGQISPEHRQVFFFAYAGVRNNANELGGVTVLTNPDILRWLTSTPKGKDYSALLSGAKG